MSTTEENIAETLARVLPEAKISDTEISSVKLLSLPLGVKVEVKDLESYLPTPRRKTGTAHFSSIDSFAQYVETHKIDGTTAWAKFDPQTFALSFIGVIDENAASTPGWRGHRAQYIPDMSAEWKTWIGKNKQTFSQVEFAEFIEANASDILASDGLPSDLQMLTMATNFIANEERKLKSHVRL